MTASAMAGKRLSQRLHPSAREADVPAGPARSPTETDSQFPEQRLASACQHCFVRNCCDAVALMRLLPDYPCATAHPQSHRLAKAARVFCQGGATNCVYFIRTGAVKTTVTNRAGDEYVTAFHLPGEVIGHDALFGSGVYSTSAVCLERTEVCAITTEQLQWFVRHTPGGLRWMLAMSGTWSMRYQRKLVMHNRMGAEKRLGSFLLELSGRYQSRGCSPIEFRLSMSRQDIANYLGMALETVSRLLHNLQRAGIVELDHLRGIRILDPTALADL